MRKTPYEAERLLQDLIGEHPEVLAGEESEGRAKTFMAANPPGGGCRARHPGIYRRGSRYVVRYRAGGRNRSEAVRTLEEARQLKRARESARDSGEF